MRVETGQKCRKSGILCLFFLYCQLFLCPSPSSSLAVTVWGRHKQIESYSSQALINKDLKTTSRVATFFGLLSAFGLFLVGNFQSTSIITIHLIGAVLAFGIGTIYLWMQSVMSLNLSPRVNGRAVMVVRFVCSVMATLFLLITIVFSVLHDMANEGKDNSYLPESSDWWRREGREKWSYHILATSNEWLLSFTYVIMLLTLVPEFKRLSFHGVKIEYDRDRRQVRETDLPRSTDAIVSTRAQDTAL
ncbi:DNA damage-regulated autophagy modulator protein 2-like isoform X3 [Portunus trituberculatus]|uniref:DNA damage-regulated autophagy modulator protein 2-like isoform X3 n=1 Tax=Portunus trituberculatus TaxID=210409 RepID=UPI001E1CBF50|nr:DNA damage-regulated autophagy modulator protein 2-like isoform X3 [Portunus trituberculatus]XP_045136322.1 DNA damage-regulated autophagy modulator protein 2-like isoform X3 [Portunus trituberculatus]